MKELLKKDATGVFPLYDATRHHRRMLEEVDELLEAMISGDRARVLDEVADVQYFLYQIARAYGVSRCVASYRQSKAVLRKHLGKDRDLELREAARLVEVSDEMDAVFAATDPMKAILRIARGEVSL